MASHREAAASRVSDKATSSSLAMPRSSGRNPSDPSCASKALERPRLAAVAENREADGAARPRMQCRGDTGDAHDHELDVLQEPVLVAAAGPSGGDGVPAAGVLNGRGGDDRGEQQAERIGGDVLLACVRFPASYPWLASGRFDDVLTTLASMIAAVGSGDRPACSRTLARSRSRFASVVPSFSHLA